jgi:membrane-associated PAP2 superfamily phosphatase
MQDFIAGLVAMGFGVSALFFLRFWSRTRDALFGVFAAAFALLAINQTLATMMDYGREELGWVYLLRLAAFILIIVGIVQKNLAARSRG